MTDCYAIWRQHYFDLEAEYSEPSRIHNTDSETDAVMVEHERERQHMSEDGTPDESKEWEDLEGEDLPPEDDEDIPTEDNIGKISDEWQKMIKQSTLWGKNAGRYIPELVTYLTAQKYTEPAIRDILHRDCIKGWSLEIIDKVLKSIFPKFYCIRCGRVSTPLLCLGCRNRTIKATIQQRLESE